MTPTKPVAEIAKQAAIEWLGNPGGDDEGAMYHQCDIDDLTKIILSAAAKMVRQSGAVQALEKWDDESAIITPPDQKDFVDVQMSPEAYEGLYAALHSLRSITGEAQPSPADPADA